MIIISHLVLFPLRRVCSFTISSVVIWWPCHWGNTVTASARKFSSFLCIRRPTCTKEKVVWAFFVMSWNCCGGEAIKVSSSRTLLHIITVILSNAGVCMHDEGWRCWGPGQLHQPLHQRAANLCFSSQGRMWKVIIPVCILLIQNMVGVTCSLMYTCFVYCRNQIKSSLQMPAGLWLYCFSALSLFHRTHSYWSFWLHSKPAAEQAADTAAPAESGRTWESPVLTNEKHLLAYPHW